MRIGVRARLGLGKLKRAAREAAIASGPASVAGRGDGEAFGGWAFAGLGSLPATSMLRRYAGLAQTGERPDWGEADGDTDVSEN